MTMIGNVLLGALWLMIGAFALAFCVSAERLTDEASGKGRKP